MGEGVFMWISRMAAAAARETAATAAPGEVTIGGADAGVYTSYEARGAIIASPGGYSWRPGAGNGVLVIKGASGESYIAGRLDDGSASLGEGEVRMAADGSGSEVLLRSNGDIVLRGHVVIDGPLDINGVRYAPVLGG